MNKIKTFFAGATLLSGIALAQSVFAVDLLPEEYVGPFSQNNVSYYDPCEGGTKKSGGGNVSVCGTELPEETVQMLEDAGIIEKAQENMERYEYAQEKTGLPWQVLAALHWREGGMDPGASISNGQPLSSGGCYTNIDGIEICSDPKKDAEQAANHIIDMGKSVYDVDIVNDPSMDSYGYAFLAYNRGYMYKCNGDVSYEKSPYVMNYYDKDHWDMTWLSGADDTDCSGNVLNSVGGSVNKQLGALAVLAYLCGSDTSGGSGKTSSGSSDTSGESGKTSSSSGETSGGSTPSSGSVSGSDITWIGDSYSVQADNKKLLSDKFSGVDIGPGSNNTSSSYIQGSKFVSSGSSSNPSCLSILEGIINSNKLRPYLVFACGTNGGWTDSDITKFQDLIKDKDVKAVVVTSKIPSNDYADSNKRLKDMAASNDKVTLADWTSVYDASYFNSDPEKIHPTTDPGYEKWIGAIEGALGGGGNCSNGGSVVKAVEEIIKLANEHGSEYKTDGANKTKEDFDAMLSGKKSIDIDCTAFAALAVYKAYGGEPVFYCSGTLVDGGLSEYYEEIDKSDAQPGDIFAYGACGSGGHGGVVIEVADGKVKKVAETGGSEGRSGSNNNIGYSTDNYTVQKVNSSDGHIFRWKGASGSPSACEDTSVCPSSSDGASGGAVSSDGLDDAAIASLVDGYNSNRDNWDSKVAVGANYCIGDASCVCATRYSNCTLFSAFFVEMFTDVDFGNGWPAGGSMVSKLSSMGFKTGTEPKAFSVFSCGAADWGHTGVVVRVDDDGTVVTAEAGYCKMIGQKVTGLSNCSGSVTYAYLNDKMDMQKLKNFIGK